MLRAMTWGGLIMSMFLLSATTDTLSGAFAGQAAQTPTATFKSGIDLVRVSATVRDRRGRLVADLASRDFEVLDNGLPRPVVEFHRDWSSVSIALLFDVSGSMEANIVHAREAATQVLAWLDEPTDEGAVFTFDTRLDEVVTFTAGLKSLPGSMSTVVPFGATSLHDAIAQAARRVATREGRHRAVVVFTDGNDTASRLSPSEVSAIAASIDVPVYIVGVVPSIDNPGSDTSTTGGRSSFAGPLSDLAEWTGGHVFVVSSAAARSIAARQIVDELRHEYLVAFESSGEPGWHPLVIRARGKDLVVRARSGYIAGQSRPMSD
jgi:Ca-activated chloride channel family protein